MTRQLPASVTRAIWLLRGVVVWSGLTAVLTYFFRDDLVLTWAQGNEAAREILDQGGLAAVKDSSINIPGFVPLAIVLFVVFASMAGVLVVFFREGYGWARLLISLTVIFVAFSTGAGLGRDLPDLFVGLSAVALGLSAVLFFYLWHRDTTAYIRSMSER